MTEQEYADRRSDASYLLGSAAHMVRAIADGRDMIARQKMAAEWIAAYDRMQAGQRAALPWIPATGARS